SDNGDDSEIRVEPTMIADPGDSDSSATSSTSISGALMRMPSRFDSREPNRVFALVELADGGRAAGFGTVLLEPTEVTATTQVAAPDGRGGVVYTAEGELWWLGESATGPTLLDDSGRRADLVGLRHVDGEPVVVALIDNELVGYDQGERRFAETFDQFSGEIVELAIDGDLAVAVVSRGDGAAAVESLSLATGEHQEVAAPVDTKEPTAPLAVAVSDGRIVILNRSAGAVVVTSDGTETGTVNLGVEALDIYSVDLAGDKVLLAFGESALAIDIVTAEREVVPTPAGWVLGAVWGDVDLGSQPVAPGEAERFRVDTEKVEADTGDPYLNVRMGPGTDNEILAKLPSTYTGLLWTGQQETTPNGATWYEVELLDPVRITPSEPLHGATPSGWVASAFIVALPEGLPATLDDVEGCAETHNTIDRGSGSRQPGHIYALESVLVAPNCLRVVLTFGTGTAPFTMEEADEGLAPANALPQIHGYMSGGSGSYLDLGDIDS
ncbi:MAG: hypothetical protein GY939_15855, partial [Actinomycetia bacterium]|nr:hypothetical protein [Actinomycetes bacterium]